jgi:hypothetical protein
MDVTLRHDFIGEAAQPWPAILKMLEDAAAEKAMMAIP